jgi:hypothetical protein
MSSVDLHGQYSYQALLPEAIAIVVAPRFHPRLVGASAATNLINAHTLTTFALCIAVSPLALVHFH